MVKFKFTIDITSRLFSLVFSLVFSLQIRLELFTKEIPSAAANSP